MPARGPRGNIVWRAETLRNWPPDRCRRLLRNENSESPQPAANGALRGLHFHRHRDGIAVILYDKNYRQLAERSGVHRFPELAFAGGAVTQRNIGDFVAAEGHILELAIVELFPIP